jgi:UDP-N-acetylglucosamine--dolichyl-phosphate N-acetylglucosaminephosphotransferase
MFATLSILAYANHSQEMLLISIPMLGALIGFFAFNRYPARVFPGDVGTLTMGVALATSVIIGNLESAGAILAIPYILDFFIKAANGMPHTRQEIRGGKLYPKDGKVKGLVHVVMKAFKGISEPDLVLFFIGLEAFFALAVLALFLR